MSFLWIYIVTPYIIANTILSILIHRKYNKYVTSKILKDFNNDEYNLHDKYPEFRRYDKISFIRIMLGMNLLVIWRVLISLSVILIYGFLMKIIDLFLKEGSFKRKCVYCLTRINTFIILCIFGLLFKLIKDDNSDIIYKKHLGINYQIDYDGKYSTIISNHISWADILIFLYLKTPAFISKKEISKVPIIGLIAKLLGSVFVDRADKDDKLKILEIIKIRQVECMENAEIKPLLIFPEGTVSSGKYLLNFKRGAFESNLPIKPYVIKSIHKHFDMSCGVLNLTTHLLISLCFFYHEIDIYDLPIINPLEIDLIQQNSSLEDKCKSFTTVSQKIMSDVAKLNISDKGFRHNIEYRDLINREETINKLMH